MTFPQLGLFEEAGKPSTSGTPFRDPSFMENKTLPLHRWVPWIAGYSASFVDDVLEAYLPQDFKNGHESIVLDPFAGVGTTLVQAMLNGYRTVGFEINPYAALAAKVKVCAPFLDLAEFDKQITRLKAYCEKRQSFAHKSRVPTGFRSRIPFFSPAVEQQVWRILDFIDDIEHKDIRDLFRVAFGAVMVSFSNYTYEPSLSTRPGAGKPLILNKNAIAVLVLKLRQMFMDIEWTQKHYQPLKANTSHQVFNANFLATAEEILSGSPVDLMITSPPYMNNYHYVRNTRPQLYWLAFMNSPSETKKIEEANFGKFWQTVRNESPVESLFVSPHIDRLVQDLRTTRQDKGAYGGPGWANYVSTYFNDATRFLKVLKNVLKTQGIGVIVIGNSIIQGIEFRVDEYFAELAGNEGLEPIGIHKVREKRVGASITQSSIRRGKSNGAVLYESAVVIQKP